MSNCKGFGRRMSAWQSKIPGAADWFGYRDDPEVRYAHDLYFGKSIEQVQSLFRDGRSIERASELLYMPRAAFRYYVCAFAIYLMSDEAAGDADAAGAFLSLLRNRETRDVGSVTQIYDELLSIVQYVAANQAAYDADPAIYGSFQDKAREVALLCCPNSEA